MKTITTTVYTFDELSDAAKEKARDWYREGGLDYEWWNSTYEDAATIGLNITGFGLDRDRHATGRLTLDARTVADKIWHEHGDKTPTYKRASDFLRAFKKAKSDDERETLTEEFERDLLEEYSMLLQRESEDIMSDERVDDNIRANEYTFTESGKRFG